MVRGLVELDREMQVDPPFVPGSKGGATSGDAAATANASATEGGATAAEPGTDTAADGATHPATKGATTTKGSGNAGQPSAHRWTPDQRGELLRLMVAVEKELKTHGRFAQWGRWMRTVAVAGVVVGGVAWLERSSR